MTRLADIPADPEASIDLLLKAKGGDNDALNRLLGRYLPRLERWASGRMPTAIRSMNDTGDIVQEAVIKALRNLGTLEIRSEGALIYYLRQSVNNAIIDQYRKHGRRPARIEIPDDAVAEETSPIEAAIGAEALARYEQALASLRDEDRQAIVLSVEMGMSHEAIAVQMNKPSSAAARMAVTRALRKLAEAMRERA